MVVMKEINSNLQRNDRNLLAKKRSRSSFRSFVKKRGRSRPIVKKYRDRDCAINDSTILMP